MAQGRIKSFVELLKPITWFAPMWAFGCGAVSAGTMPDGHWPYLVAGIILAGPLVCGSSQAVNDWFDRHVDAINEPNRPIPSGRIPGRWGLYIALIGGALSIVVSYFLGPWVLAAAIFALFFGWTYSAPPLRLKQNGWWGNLACGICYEGLPWFTAAAVIAGTLPDPRTILLAVLYSIGAHGIMTLNDFKAVEGDIKLGIKSLPVQLGVDRAVRVACAVMVIPQVIVIGLLFQWGTMYFALGVLAVLIAQFALMPKLLRDPEANSPWYNATGTTLYVIGMLISAFALRSLIP